MKSVNQKGQNSSEPLVEFQSIKEEVVLIHNDLQTSEANNKKLREYIHNQVSFYTNNRETHLLRISKSKLLFKILMHLRIRTVF